MIRILILLLLFCRELPAFMIGIAGGSASGKTTLANNLKTLFGDRVVIVHQDDYYRSKQEIPLNEFGKPNYACPEAIDVALLKKDLIALAAGQPVNSPVYNFTVSKREPFTQLKEPAEIVIVEGFLILALSEIRELLNCKIFVDTDGDIRLLRRIDRDMQERGRSLDHVKSQYTEEVKPMHEKYVEPSKQYADMIIRNSQGCIDFIKQLVP